VRIELCRRSFKRWGHLATRSTPASPEVDQQRDVARAGKLLEI
jgi:hypothetical protein